MSQFFVRAKGKWKEFITSFTGHFRLRYSNLQSFKKGNYPQYHSSYHLPIGSEGAPRVKQANVSLVFQETINNLFLRRMQAYAPRTSIMEFHNEDDLAGWRIITDESMGGLSHGSLRLESGIHPSTGKPIKVMIFEGEIYALKKLAAPEALPLMVRTFSPSAPKADFDDEKTAEIENGFVGIMYTFNPALDVEHWNTYAVGMQTDGQEWVCVVKNQPNLNGNQEIYLAATPTDKGRPLRELRIEWSDFTATLVGKTKKIPVTVDTSRLETIGFSLRAKPGPFKLKLGWIHARDPLQEDDETEALVRRVGATVDEASHIPTVLMQKRGRPGTNESVHTKYENTNGSTTSRALQQSEDSLATDEKTTASRSRSVSYAKFDREILNNLKGEVKVRRTGRLKSVKTGGVLNSADYEEELALAELVGLPLTKRSLQEDENPSRSTEEEEATHDARNVDELDATKRNTTKEEKNERMYPYFQDTDTPKP